MKQSKQSFLIRVNFSERDVFVKRPGCVMTLGVSARKGHLFWIIPKTCYSPLVNCFELEKQMGKFLQIKIVKYF